MHDFVTEKALLKSHRVFGAICSQQELGELKDFLRKELIQIHSAYYDSRKSLPVFIPFVFSERQHIKQFLSKINIEKHCQKAFKLRDSVSIEHHINQL